jgi:hypothetical protein
MEARKIGIRFLGNLKRLERKPGDVFVLMCSQLLTGEVRFHIQHEWHNAWEGQQGRVPTLLILQEGMKLGVVGDAPKIEGDAQPG